MDKEFLLAESTWDVNCFKKIFGKNIKNYKLYDYSKEKRNVSKRLFRFVFAIFVILLNSSRGYKIYISDMNFEGLFFLKFFKNAVAFTPNLLGNCGSEKRTEILTNCAREGRLICSDAVTQEIFRNEQTEKAFSLSSLNEIDCGSEYTYLVILPATFSHKATKDNAEVAYLELVEICNRLISLGKKVKYKVHPRDWASHQEQVKKLIDDKLICHKPHYTSSVIYLSFFSSVSLNKHYGEGLGFWLCNELSTAELFNFQEFFDFAITTESLLEHLR